AGAVDILVPALKNGAQDIELLTLLGQAYAQNNQPEFAARLSQQMESVGAGDETLRTQRALTSLAMRGKPNDDPEQAESDLDLGTGEGGAGVLLGVLQLRKGDPKAVLKTVRVLRDQRPNSASVQNLVGAIELVAGEVEASRASFARALAADSTFRPVLRNLARADARAGSFTAAVQRLEQLVAQDATDLRAMSELAAIAERQGQFAKAVDWLKRVRQQNPAAIAPQLRLLDVCIKDRRLADAGQLVDELAVAFPTSIHVRIARGRVQLAAGDRGRATATFRELSAQEESSSDRSLRLVKFQLATNDVDGARETLLRIESRDPGLLPAQESLLALELREGKAKEALARVVQLRERHPDAAIVDRLHGDVLMHSVDFAAAAAAYRKAHATDQTETYAIALFTALHRSGDLDGAIRFLQGWVNSGNSGLTPAHKALAAGLLALERNDQARQVFQNLQALGADDPLVLAGLARMKIRSGDMASAKAHAERAYAVAPTDVAALDAMGWLLVHSDDSSAGLRLLREAHDRDSTAQRVRYHIAVALHQLGRKAEARRELDHVLSDSRPFDGRIDAQALLERL
ncbi:MAG: putative PEP-CTERM system TPR-repeat lipoprotein, partial [Gammaproteobacteria bacterium]